MHVIGCVKVPSPARGVSLLESGVHLTDTDEILRSADFVSLHVPLTDSTRGMIGAGALSRMKRGAFLINTARGGVLDEEALYGALLEGRLAGAALDVHREEGENTVSPLAQLPNVILTPHIGATTVDTQREIGRRAVEIINAFEADETGVELAAEPIGAW